MAATIAALRHSNRTSRSSVGSLRYRYGVSRVSLDRVERARARRRRVPPASAGNARAARDGTRRAPRRGLAVFAQLAVDVRPLGAGSRHPRADVQVAVDVYRSPEADEDAGRHRREAMPRGEQTARFVQARPLRARRARCRGRPGAARRSGTSPRTRWRPPPSASASGSRSRCRRTPSTPGRGVEECSR